MLDGSDMFGPAPPAPHDAKAARRASRQRSANKKAAKDAAAAELRDRIRDAEAALGDRRGLRVAQMALPTPADSTFDYLIPAPLAREVARGVRAKVPFGRRTLTGFVVGITEASDIPHEQLKPLLELPDASPLVNDGMLRLTEWMSRYYACSWGEALQAVIPAVIRRGKALRTVNVLRLGKPKRVCLAYADDLDGRATKSENSPLRKQAKVLRTVANFEDENWRPAVLAETLGFSESPILTLRKDGWLEIERVPLQDEAVQGLESADAPGPLNAEQERAIAAIRPTIDADEYKTFLLRGVTGSGKTEVYIHVLEHVLAAGKAAIVLVPEISLTPQTVKRFSERLRGRYDVAVLHSAMTDSDRRRQWRRIESGEARVVIGPRSAVFAPVKDLGLIVVDEEHEPSYKQEHTPRYHARDVAVMRCHLESAVCLLGSATPSLESAHNAVNHKYKLVEIAQRVLDRKLPRVAIVDMADECRQQKRLATLSGLLLRELVDTVKRREQAIMFLNRRGYHTYYQCDNCHELLQCKNCAVPMHQHRSMKEAVCHYCFETIKPPPRCTLCNVGSVRPKGMGTELLEEELAVALPGARLGRMDSDVMKGREDYEEVLGAFRRREIDVLVGTQMIAKGLDFPGVTLVGVVQADASIHLADFRAQERTFQLLTQVAGRAGRGEAAGRVVVQTFTPEHPCIRFAQAQDYWGFFGYEIRQRELAKYPPFVRLLNITIEATEEAKGRETGRIIRATLDAWRESRPKDVLGVLGPAIAPMARIRGRHRWQIIVKARNHAAMAEICGQVKSYARSGERFRVTLDVDPFSML